MNHTVDRVVHEVSVAGTFTFEDEEPLEYHTRSGLVRRITSVTYSSRFRADKRPYVTVCYHGHNVKKDGSLGAEFHDSWPHHESRYFEERKRQIEAAARREVFAAQAREFGEGV